ncbi:MAG: Gfo/Idh/MocA family oxidoreductase [Patescibacteria group bacterium]|jgi:predicted dehydrogenase
MDKLKALIVGAGKIGAYFDTPNSKNIITHAHAYTEHPGFKLVGFVDNDTERGTKAAKAWGCRSFKDIDEAFSSESIDVVSVCVPDDFHAEILKSLMTKSIKAIFAEKPITKTLLEAVEIVKICEERSIALQVNYSRRFVPELINLAEAVKAGEYGNFICGTAYYGKGVMHNGSHMVDLLRMFLGEAGAFEPFARENDFSTDDPSVSGILKINSGNVAFLAIGSKNYTIFELELLFASGRIQIRNSGNDVEIWRVEKSDEFEGYKYLVKENNLKTSLNRSIYFAADNIFSHLTKKETLLCSAKEAIADLETAINMKGS